MLFEFLTTEPRKREIQTSEEMIEKNYTFYLSDSYIRIFKEMELYRRFASIFFQVNLKFFIYFFRANFQLLNYTHFDFSIYKKLEDPSFKGGLLTTTTHLDQVKNYNFDWRVLKEILVSTNLGLVFKAHNFLYQPFNGKIQQLIPSGIIDYWIQFYGTKKLGSSAPSGPIVLTMDHLMIGFQVTLVSLGLALIAFIIECRHLCRKLCVAIKRKCLT